MKHGLKVLIGAALLAAVSGTAAARDNVRFSLSIGAPAYVAAPAPYYYAPPPVPAYYAPAPVYYPPAAAYYPAPRVYYAPAWVGRGHRGGWHRYYR
jgi:hypothetical protein